MTRSRVWILNEPLDVFTVRDLRQCPGDLLRAAEEGKLTLITHHGRPAFVAVPFDERLFAYIELEGLEHDSVVNLDQVQAVDQKKLQHFVGTVGPGKMTAVCRALLGGYRVRRLNLKLPP